MANKNQKPYYFIKEEKSFISNIVLFSSGVKIKQVNVVSPAFFIAQV